MFDLHIVTGDVGNICISLRFPINLDTYLYSVENIFEKSLRKKVK